MTIVSATTTAVRTVTLEIDGRTVTAPEGTTIYAAAAEAGIVATALLDGAPACCSAGDSTGR